MTSKQIEQRISRYGDGIGIWQTALQLAIMNERSAEALKFLNEPRRPLVTVHPPIKLRRRKVDAEFIVKPRRGAK